MTVPATTVLATTVPASEPNNEQANRSRPAYLDCAASTPMRPAAVEAMLPWLQTNFANPSGAHKMARNSRHAIDDAREIVANALGFSPHDIVFTSGGTESDNLAVRGITAATGTVALCPATEHYAVLEPVLACGGRTVNVHQNGRIDLDHLAQQLQPEAGPPVGLVSVMLSNNETGVIADLDEIADVVATHAPQAKLHTDAVQAVNWTNISIAAARADLLSLSGHKFGGPKGVGVLAIRDSAGDLSAQLLGGGQEAERRSGTHNTAGIVALGTALAELDETRDADIERLCAERDRLAAGLVAAIDGCKLSVGSAQADSTQTGTAQTGTAEVATAEAAATAGVADTTQGGTTDVAAGMCQLLINQIQTEALLVLLDRGEVMASAAASCSSGAMEPSHVLAAMGYSRAEAAGSLRLSLGWCSESWEVDHALEVIPDCVRQIRESGI